MVWTIDNYKELKTTNLIKNDNVCFPVPPNIPSNIDLEDYFHPDKIKSRNLNLKYYVTETHLSGYYVWNGAIFKLLGINSSIIADNYYGYQHRGGAWPEYRRQDYDAATRLTYALFRRIESELNRTPDDMA